MGYQDKEGSGTLFPNDKGGNDKRPDWRGTIMLGGVTYEVSGWTKQGNRGEFISLAGKVKGERSESRPAPQRPAPKREPSGFEGDSIPF